MILGYEQPVDIPVMSIYDKDMMKMYLGALQQDYKEGLEEQKEFNKTAADFYSPSDVDNQNWYNLTAKPLQDYLNQNPNAIRSVEGRAWIRNFINSRPYDKMAQMKQSAEALKNYKDLASKLKAAGKFSQDLEDVLGVGDPNTWDTLKDGAWQWESPTEMQSVYDLTHERFDPLAKLDFDLGPGRDIYHRMKGVTEDHMRPIAKTALDGIRNTPYYKLFLKRYGSDEAIEDAFINANKGVLHNAEVTDEVELTKLKEAGEDRRAARRGSNTTPTESPYSITSQIQNDSTGGLGFNNIPEYASTVSSRASQKIAAAEKKSGKPLSEMEKKKITSDVEHRIQQEAIHKYNLAGYSMSESVLKAGTSTAPVDDLSRAIWSDLGYQNSNRNEQIDDNGYIKLTNGQKKNLYTKNQITQLYAREKYRKRVAKPNTTKVTAAKVEYTDNVYRVFDPELNKHRFFVAVEGNDGKQYYIEATQNLDPRSANGQRVDAKHNKDVGQGSKALYNVEGND